MDRRSLALVAVLASAVACEKKTRTAPAPAPVEVVAKPAVVDVSRLTAPALFASVPTDTPYMLAAFEAIPLEYYAKFKRAVGPAMGSAFAQLGTLMEDEGADRVMTAIAQELEGKWDAKGLESLGFTASPRFALYGLGVAPVVFRIEVRDDKAVLATIDRIAQRAGVTLTAPQTQDARSFWRKQSKDGETASILALADKQLVVAFGRTAEIDKNLGLILGSEKPQASMASGKALTDIMVKHGFGPHLIGFVDTRKMITQGMEFAGQPPSPACTTEIARLGARVPRAVLGYTLLGPSMSSGGAILELAPDLVAQLQGLRTQVPGLTEAVAGKPMFAVGLGIQIDGARKLALDAAAAVRRLGEACELAKLVEQAADAGDTLSRPLPGPLATMTGLVMAVHEISFGTSSPVPDKIEGYAALTSTNAQALWGQLEAAEPKLGKLGIRADGRVHAVTGLGVPFPIHGGVGERAIVLGIGTKGKPLAESAIGTRATTNAPFMVMTYDYGKFLELQSQVSLLVSGADPLQEVERKLNEGLATLFGRAAASLDVGTHGLAFWGTIEMK